MWSGVRAYRRKVGSVRTENRAKEQIKKRSLGYRTFRCSLQVVLWQLRYTLSLRDLAEIFVARGFGFTHEAVRTWEARLAPLIADQLQERRHGQTGTSWYVDET